MLSFPATEAVTEGKGLVVMESVPLGSIDVSLALPFDPPAREQVCGDHDEPWQFQLYHLSERERLRLLLRRERAAAAEWGA